MAVMLYMKETRNLKCQVPCLETKACKYARCSVATQVQVSKETLGTDIQQATIYQVEEETRNKGNGEKKSGNLLGPVLQKGNGA